MSAAPAPTRPQDAPVTVRLELPQEVAARERAAAAPGYALGAETPIPPDPDAPPDARFFDPISIIAEVTIAMLAWRVINHLLTSIGRGVLIDTRQTPAVVSGLHDIPAGFVVIVKPDGTTETVAAGKTDDATLAGLIAKAMGGGAAAAAVA